MVVQYANVFGFVVAHLWPGFILGLVWHFIFFKLNAARFAELIGAGAGSDS